MKTFFETQTLSDGSQVFNVRIEDGDYSTLEVACNDAAAAIAFRDGFEELISKFTVESIQP